MAISKVGLTTAVTGTLPAANGGTGATSFSPGKVLQVVQSTTTTTVTHSTTFADTGLSATITPSSTSNKILVLINQHCYAQGAGGGSVKLFRDSTAIQTFSQNYAFYVDISNANVRQYFSFNHLDTPSSTSALTFKTQARGYASSTAFLTQNDGFKSYITLMEVSA